MDQVDPGASVFRHPIFKGATRPPMVFGVPLKAFVPLSCAFAILAAWCSRMWSPYAALILVLIYGPLLLELRRLTHKDDQRLRQVVLRWWFRWRQFNRWHWRAFSYSPIRYKRRTR